MSAIVQHLDQFQTESNQSNDFHRRRATVDYIPKAHSKLPFNYAAVAWEVMTHLNTVSCLMGLESSICISAAILTCVSSRKPEVIEST